MLSYYVLMDPITLFFGIAANLGPLQGSEKIKLYFPFDGNVRVWFLVCPAALIKSPNNHGDLQHLDPRFLLLVYEL